jgi:transcriptional regulator with XRE-family HTH domain
MSIGEAIRAIRRARGWTQGRLAEHLGVPQQRVSEWERNLHVPSAVVVARLLALVLADAQALVDALAAHGGPGEEG